MRPKKKKYRIKDTGKVLHRSWVYKTEEYENIADKIILHRSNPYYYTPKTSCKKYYKKVCNKKVRKFKNHISNGNDYRKIEEYHWMIY